VRTELLGKPKVPRAEVIDELAAAVVDGVAPLHDGAWGLATLEACLAMLESSRTGREVALARQCRPHGIIRA
jgi:phthalate 4,5-cis-dihydrodiol dehydrogenase